MLDSLLDFRGQVALITGAGGGFGRLLSQGLAARGCKLILSDINSTLLDETVASLGVDKNDVLAQLCDVSKEQECKALVDAGVEKFGRLDIAVNNAGIAHKMAPLHLLDESTMLSQMAINVNGVMFGMKYQINQMLKAGTGHILNISSMAGIGGAPKGAAYSAAKHAVVGLSRTAAVEYGSKGIRTNAICPFFSPTNIMSTAADGFDSEENQARLAQGSPMKRLPAPQEVVNTMLLILSPGNSYMNGQTIAIDGGVSAW